MSDRDVYEMEATCKNCGHADIVQIPRGQNTGLHTCSYCGCRGCSWDFTWRKPEQEE